MIVDRGILIVVKWYTGNEEVVYRLFAIHITSSQLR